MSAQSVPTHGLAETGREVVASKIWWVGLLAVVAVIAANLLVCAILFALITLPDNFPPLQPGAIASFMAMVSA
jgi:hypothetical protein